MARILQSKFNFLKNKTPLIFRGFCFVLCIFLLFPTASKALTLSENDTVTISAIVGSGGTNNNGNGGNGGHGGMETTTTINFSGLAYPLSKVTILKNGIVAGTTLSDAQANFYFTLNNLTVGTYNFSIFTEDIKGQRSQSFSFPIYFTKGAIINVSRIFLSPTIYINKTQIKKSEPLVISGQTTPYSIVNIYIHSKEEIMRNTTTDVNGLYRYSINTDLFDYGNYTIKTKTLKNNNVSAMSVALPFVVGFDSKEVPLCSTMRGDLNCDGKVNIIDFSIMAYWYGRSHPPKNIDLNGDGKITLPDFSIMAFYWTG